MSRRQRLSKVQQSQQTLLLIDVDEKYVTKKPQAEGDAGTLNARGHDRRVYKLIAPLKRREHCLAMAMEDARVSYRESLGDPDRNPTK